MIVNCDLLSQHIKTLQCQLTFKTGLSIIAVIARSKNKTIIIPTHMCMQVTPSNLSNIT